MMRTLVVGIILALIACSERAPARSKELVVQVAKPSAANPSAVPRPNDASPLRGCLASPPVLRIDQPERDLHEVEAISNALKKETMDGFCRALRGFDVEGATRIFSPDARIQRFGKRTERVLLESRFARATLETPEKPECFGDRPAFVRDLRSLLGSWVRVDRCFFKAFRVFATPSDAASRKSGGRRANVELHFWIGGVEPTGARVGEKGDVTAEVREGREGWHVTALRFGERERFRTTGLAFTDHTERARLPTTWPDVGYPKDMNHGQILFGGVAIGDYDGDRWPDLYIARTGKNVLLRNDGRGGFEDVTAKAGVGDPGNSQSAVFADFDNDGDLDLFVVNAHYVSVTGKHGKRGHQLYRNNGNGTFTRAAQRFDPIGPATGAAVADYDGDGLLDIYVTYYQDDDVVPYHHYIEAKNGFGNRLFRNRGGLRFEDVTAKAGVGGNAWSFAPAWADYDGDGRIDLYVANDFGDSYLFRNRGDGTFEELAERAGAPNPANGMSADWGDYDNDGHLDLYVANMYSKTGNQVLPLYPDLDAELRRKLLFSVKGNSLYRNRGNGTFEEVGRRLGAALGGWAWGSNFLDFDNDGWLDIHVANGFWSGETKDDF